jgi:hypothetical protein
VVEESTDEILNNSKEGDSLGVLPLKYLPLEVI